MQFLILGASIQNANRGVSALAYAAVKNLNKAFPAASIVLSEQGLDHRKRLDLGDTQIEYETSWLSTVPGIARRSSVGHLGLLQKLRYIAPGLGTKWIKNRTFQQLCDTDVVFDLSGGDSFADIYGPAVFQSNCRQKEFALSLGKPLVLLPQTLGPFTSTPAKLRASKILDKACLVATREAAGLRELESWYGELNSRFVSCPDLAISMLPMAIPNFQWPFQRFENSQLIGINVSGLLWDSNVDFSIASNYRDFVWQLIEWAVNTPNSEVLLIPHVFNKRRHVPSTSHGLNEHPELELTIELAKEAKERLGARVHAIDQAYSAPELKWIIGHCDFFVGARMHACIAGLSQAVPTVTLAYSKKAVGVLGMLNAQDLVVDLRNTDTSNALRSIQEIYLARHGWRNQLQKEVEQSQRSVEQFFFESLPQALDVVPKAK